MATSNSECDAADSRTKSYLSVVAQSKKESNASEPGVVDSHQSLDKKVHSEGEPRDFDTGDDENDTEEPIPLVPYLQLFRFASRPDKVLLALGVLSSILHGCLQPISFIFVGELFGDLSGTSINGTYTGLDMDAVEEGCLYITYLAIASFGLSYFQVLALSSVSVRQGIHLRTEYFRALLRQEIGWFDDQMSGALTAQVSAQVNAVETAINDKLGSSIQFFACFVASFVVAFVYSWELTLVCLAAVPVMGIVSAIFLADMGEADAESDKLYSEAGGIASEALDMIRTVVSFGCEDLTLSKYSDRLANAQTQGMKKFQKMGIGIGFLFGCIYGMYGLAFWYGSKLTREGDIDGDDVIIAFFAIITGAFSLGPIGQNAPVFKAGQAAARTIFDTIDRESKIDALSEEGSSPLECKGSISIKDVAFAYPTRSDEPVFESLSVDIPAGANVAFVGESGCGKSTIVNLIERFYDPLAGTVSVDGTNVQELNVQWLRSQIAYVQQHPTLFPTTIFKNIAGGVENATQQQVEAAAKAANAHDFIIGFPKGYETPIGGSGPQLSGGQKQRIAIARAIIKQPKILLLDEATSALDTKSERIVQAALQESATGRTTISIAHRLSSIRGCDQIYVLDQGQIRERGTHNELLAIDGHYAAMTKAQELADAQDDQCNTSSEGKFEGDTQSSPTQKVTGTSDATSTEGSDERKSSSVDNKTSGSEEDKTEEDIDNEAFDSNIRDMDVGHFKWVWRMAKPERLSFFVGIFMALINGAAVPGYCVILSYLLTELLGEGNDEDTMDAYALGMFGLGVFVLIVHIIQFKALGFAGEGVTRRMRFLSISQIMANPVSWFDLPGHSKSSLSARLATDASKVRGLFADRISIILQTTAQVLGGLVVALIFCWRMSLVILALLPLIGAAAAMQIKLMMGLNASDKFEQAGEFAAQSVEHIREVLTVGRVAHQVDVFAGQLAMVRKELRRGAAATALAFGFSEFCMMGVFAAVFIWGAYILDQGWCDYLEFNIALTCALFPIMFAGQALAQIPDIAAIKKACERIYSLIGPVGEGWPDSPAALLSRGPQLAPTIHGEIELRDVHFAYPARPDTEVLKGVSLKVAEGETVALVGASGCGKSTIMGLIMQFYEPDSGEILIDGVSTKDLDARHVRRSIGYVQQEPTLFSMTIRENIAYGREGEASIEEVEAAASRALAADFIQETSMKYETVVGERGLKLSGGQRQRIAIARAFIRAKAVRMLLLDEATSALDNVSEEKLKVEFEKWSEQCTTLVIAHRLSTIQNADRIVLFDDGRIIEEGTYTELMKTDTAFRKMVEAQSLNSD